MQDDPPPPPFTAELAATIKAADAALAQHRHPPLAMAKERERGGGIQEKGKIDFQKAKAGTEWLKTLADTVLQDKKEASEESKTHPDAITQDKKEASEKKAPATFQAVLPEEPHWTTFCARRVLLPLQLVLYPITCGPVGAAFLALGIIPDFFLLIFRAFFGVCMACDDSAAIWFPSQFTIVLLGVVFGPTGAWFAFVVLGCEPSSDEQGPVAFLLMLGNTLAVQELLRLCPRFKPYSQQGDGKSPSNGAFVDHDREHTTTWGWEVSLLEIEGCCNVKSVPKKFGSRYDILVYCQEQQKQTRTNVEGKAGAVKKSTSGPGLV